MSFFESITTASGETRIKIGLLSLSPSDSIKLLQTILIKKDAINSDVTYHNILKKAHNILLKEGADSVQTIVEPLYQKLLVLFRLLISMEDGSPLQNVEWARVDACLVDIDAEMKPIFKQHYWKIKGLHYVLVVFFQTFLEDARTKKVISKALTEASVQPILGQMIVNEYQDFGVTAPVVVPVNAGYLGTEDIDAGLLDAVIEKIAVIERIAMDRSDDESLHHIRDLAYLQVLSSEDFFYHNAALGTGRQTCRLSALTQEQLVELAYTIMQPSEDGFTTQRTVLQTLAILHALYRKMTGTSLSEQDLASILLALKQSQFELQWQLDADRTSPGALLLYTSLLCLRGDVVHIEQAERLLAMQSAESQGRKFLKQLNIVYTESIHRSVTKIGVMHARELSAQSHTYYFGSQAIRFFEHPAVNLYLAQALLKMKQRVLQPFDAWYALLWPMVDQSPVLQGYREKLLANLDQTWMQYVHTHLPCHDLQSIDHMIEQFQRDILVQVWKKTEKKLFEFISTKISPAAFERLAFLRKQSEVTYAILSKQHFGRYAASLTTLHGYDEGVKQVSQARLYYDRAYLLQEERMQWIQRYLKHHLLHLQRLCPEVKKTPVPSEQFEIMIRYLAEKCEQRAFSAEWVAAMNLCVDLYHCTHSILTWSDEPSVRTNVAALAMVSSSNAIQTLGATVLGRLHWVTQTDSFYYQWLESHTVKQAAHKMYDLAQRLSVEPNNKDVLKDFVQTLFEQQTILGQLWWYFPFGWFFGYADPRELCATTLQKVNQMVSLQQISTDLWQEANEAARCAPFMQAFQNAVQGIRLDTRQLVAWQTVMQEVQAIQSNHSGFAMVYELQAYLQTQRQKFILCRQGYFYGSRQTDQIDPLLKILDHARCDIEKTTQGSLASRAFLAKKIQKVQAKSENIAEISVQPGYFNDYFFDMWTNPKMGEAHCKRFYHANDFFAFTRKMESLEETHLACEISAQL